MSLKGKTAIVTGGGRDIGRATAIRLAQAGANVVINYHSSSGGAASAVAQIEAMGKSAIALQGDMTSEQEVGKLVTAAVDKFGKIDIVAHITGGLVARKPLPELSVDHWQTVMDLNATSFLLVVRAVLPKMENSGSIVVTASQAARDGGGPGAIAYAAAKGAVVSMVRGMAKELGPGIRVNSVCPGMIDTDFHSTFTKPEVRKNVANATPLKREGKTEDVANLICYLASEDASFITGSNIDINGGTLFS
eukprot:GHVN01040218.1.p1 GENE.GHVN01040218.1~~GHVN01040218.1.p1  ORF type:complete len:249 (-),score=33.84 GHVN01040218.1:344-1090(-)